jgi:DNA repair protein RecO (recombination protein O)
MLVTARCFVLSTQPYSDTSLIIRAYSREFGLISFLAKGVRSPRNKKRLGSVRPLHFVEIVFYKSQKTTLHLIRDFKALFPYLTISENYEKTAIVLFLNEVLQKSLKEEQGNEPLFDFIQTSLMWLDVSDKYLNFHPHFLVALSRFLGFAPLDNYSPHNLSFNLEEGVFSGALPGHSQATEAESRLISAISRNLNYGDDPLSGISNEERRNLLRALVRFYDQHVANFTPVKSLEVLETVFSG